MDTLPPFTFRRFCPGSVKPVDVEISQGCLMLFTRQAPWLVWGICEERYDASELAELLTDERVAKRDIASWIFSTVSSCDPKPRLVIDRKLYRTEFTASMRRLPCRRMLFDDFEAFRAEMARLFGRRRWQPLLPCDWSPSEQDLREMYKFWDSGEWSATEAREHRAWRHRMFAGSVLEHTY